MDISRTDKDKIVETPSPSLPERIERRDVQIDTPGMTVIDQKVKEVVKQSGTSPTAREYRATAYLPAPSQQRRGIALCLSGGGYRATLFHLGAVRRLNELGVLGQIDTITSASGGSIFSGFLALYLKGHVPLWPPVGGVISNWEAGIAEPLRAFTRKNIRSRAILMYLNPMNWIRRGVP